MSVTLQITQVTRNITLSVTQNGQVFTLKRKTYQTPLGIEGEKGETGDSSFAQVWATNTLME